MKFNIDKERLKVNSFLVTIVFYLIVIPSVFAVYGVNNNLQGFENSKGVYDSIGPVIGAWWIINGVSVIVILLLIEIQKTFFKKEQNKS